MRAVEISQPGGPEVLRLAEVANPAPQANEIVVRAEAPGFDANEFEVNASGNVLTIRAEHREGEPQKKDEEQKTGTWGYRRFDVLERQPAIGERARDALRHQVDRRQTFGHLAEIGFGNADDRR